MNMTRLGLTAAIITTLTACSSLPEGRWQESTPAAGTKAMTLDIQKDRISAYAGCNRMMGKAQMEGNHLVVGNMASTLMMCHGQNAKREEALKQLLASKPVVEQHGDQLTLSSGDEHYTFTKQPLMEEGKTRFVYVAPEKAPCVGVAPMQCLQIREDKNQPWTLYYGTIEGFAPEPGIAYRLRIKEFDVPNPPADASSKRWILDMIVEQEVITP